MPQARLTLTLPETVWIGDLSRSHPDVRFRILSAFAGDDIGVGLVEIIGPDIDAVLSDMGTYESISDIEILQLAGSRALSQFETTFPLLLLPAQSSGVPLEMPFEIVDGNAVWELTAPRDRLSELGDQLDAFGIQFTVERVRQRIESDELLTDRQLRLVHAAVDHGYYDTPRVCSLTELADELDLAKSTCSETLHRAEGRIIKRFLTDQIVESPIDTPSPSPTS